MPVTSVFASGVAWLTAINPARHTFWLTVARFWNGETAQGRAVERPNQIIKFFIQGSFKNVEQG